MDARAHQAADRSDLGFALGPRINAGGRVGKSDLGVRLLTDVGPGGSRRHRAELNRLNEERRAIEAAVLEAGDRGAAPIVRQCAVAIVAGRAGIPA
jgi:single-stranded-DNA-specific exonuclease